MIKTIDEKIEVKFCMYCASKLVRVSLNVKKCPNDCVEITFKKPVDAFEELLKERKHANNLSMRGCGCQYPMIS